MLRFILAALLLLGITGVVQADDAAAAAAAKMRDALRNTMLQLRTIQAERDALQVEKTTLEQEKKDLTEKLAAALKQLVADKDASDKTIAELKDKTALQANDLMEVRATLEKWKVSHTEAVNVAKAKDEARATLAGQALELKRKVADQQRRNWSMYEVGKEILSRYEKFGLGTAITAREPFVGTMRVKLENLVQDYGDKLAEQRIKPDAPARAGR